MKHKIIHYKLAILLGFLCCSFALVAQETVVSGKVTSGNEEVIGATVQVKNTTIGVITDVNGSYTITVPDPQAILVFSYIGYQPQEIAVKGQKIINVELKEDIKQLEEVVVVGYGTLKKKDLTGAITRISMADNENKSVTNVTELLRGTVAGFSAGFGTSAKGGGSMLIRGTKSIKANNSPLIVLDGVIFNGAIGDINPSDIESIDILKDGSSAAVYGSRAAAGVVVITTKQGKTDKPVITFDAKIGVSGLTVNQRPFDGQEYTLMRRDVLMRNNPTKPAGYYYNPNQLPAGVSLNTWLGYDPGAENNDPMTTWLRRLSFSSTEVDNYLAGRETDWYDEAFQNGLRQDYNASISGKYDKLTYYWSLGSIRNNGIVVGDTYQAIRSRLNLKADVTNYLQVGLQAHYATQDESNDEVDWAEAIKASPWGSKYEEDGSLKFYPNDDLMGKNPYSAYEQRDRLNKTQTFNATISAKLTLPYGFVYEMNYSDYNKWQKNHYFDPSNSIAGSNSKGKAVRRDSSSHSWLFDNILRWSKTYNHIHRFDFTFLFNLEKNEDWSGNATNTEIVPSEALGFHGIQNGKNPSVTSSDGVDTGNALMFRLNYGFKDRYLLTASFRRDGYSAFGSQNPYANFPAVALGWRINEEKFMQGFTWLDNLKLRLSWGINGNRDIGRYAALSELDSEKYIHDGSTVIGIYTKNLANKQLKWEKTEAYNVGLDFGLFGNRLSGTIEAYRMSTKDLLLNRALPNIIGFADVMSNLGEVQNKGFEITLNSVNIDNRNFKWSSNLVTSFNRNEIVHLYGEQQNILDDKGNIIGTREADDIQNGWYIGHALDEIYDYKIVGVWQQGEEAEAAKYGKQPGDYKILDVNNDGQYLPEDDKVFQGYKKPRFSFGLGNTFELFKCIDLSFFIRSDLGHYGTNNHYAHSTDYYYDRINAYKYGYWTPSNPTDEYARLGSNTKSPSFNVYEKRSFVRLQDITLAYRLPKKLLNKISVNNARVYFNVSNACVFDNWNYWDPETMSPAPRTFTFGLNFTL